MSGVGSLARAGLRGRLRAVVGTAVLLGVLGGLSMVALAGARRTQSAYPRFLRSVASSTMSVSSPTTYDAESTALVASLPGVVQSRTYVSFTSYVLEDGRPDFTQDVESVGSFDGRFFDQDRFVPTSGRTPDPDRTGEAAVNELAAERYGYHVGQRLDIGLYGLDQGGDASFFTDPIPPRAHEVVTIVGIGLFPEEVVPDEGDIGTRLLVTPAFTRMAAPYITYGFQGLVLRDGDAGVTRIKRAVFDRFPDSSFEFRRTADDQAHAVQAVRPLTVALAGFGVVAGLVGLALGVQALGRLAARGQEDREVLRAIGAAPQALAAATAAGPLLAVVSGSLLALVVAVLASPLMPLGPVRKVEPDPGVDLDLAVIGFGVLIMVVVLGAVASVVSVRSRARRTAAPERPSRTIERAARAGFGPTALTGLRFAFERSAGRTAGIGRSVALGAAVAVAALIGAITFGASLDDLVHEPSHYGWAGEVAILSGDGYGNIPEGRAAAILGRDPMVDAWSGATFGEAEIGGRDVPLLGMDVAAEVAPPLLDGRGLQRDDEVVLGAQTASLLGKEVGDRVTFTGAGGAVPLTVVGIATLPTIGAAHASHTSLGNGALVTVERVPGHEFDITGTKQGDFGPRGIFVRLRPGTDVDAALAHLRRTTAPLADFSGLDVLGVRRPAEIIDADSIGSAPVLLASALAVGSALSLVLALLAAVRRRRRDLSVLRMLGFTRRQLATTIGWQSTSIVLVGLVIGVPIGVVLGRALWSAFGDELGVVVRPVVPWLLVAAVAAGAIVLAAAVATVPGRAAGRTAASVTTDR